MAKFTNGPDWTDVEIYLRALDALHGGVTVVAFSAEGIGSTGGLHITIMSTFDALPGSDQARVVETQNKWPCKDCPSIPEHVYNGLYVHDYAIGLAYQQQKWPEA